MLLTCGSGRLWLTGVLGAAGKYRRQKYARLSQYLAHELLNPEQMASAVTLRLIACLVLQDVQHGGVPTLGC